MTEQTKQTISVISNKLPKFMIPGFNRIVSENQDNYWFDEFVSTYNDYLDDAAKQGIDPISPATALGEYNKRFCETETPCVCEAESPCCTCEPEEVSDIQECKPEENDETTDDISDAIEEAKIADDADELENEEELLEDETVDII